MKLGECVHDGLDIVIRQHFAFLDEDGVHWDCAETYNHARPNPHMNPWKDENEKGEELHNREAESSLRETWDAFPEGNRAWYEDYMLLPYANIIAIDEEGDEIFRSPHIYTGPWHHENGPFLPYTWSILKTIGHPDRHARPSLDTRIKKFPRRKKSQK